MTVPGCAECEAALGYMPPVLKVDTSNTAGTFSVWMPFPPPIWGLALRAWAAFYTHNRKSKKGG